jgi:hypothetical protein
MAESWWIKLARAEKHMVDLTEEARAYDEDHPYETLRLGQPASQQNVGQYTLHFTIQPDEMIAAIIGDCVHNLRSAMDHIVVRFTRTSKQRQSANWPICTEDFWLKDAGRRYVLRDPEPRRRYRQAVEGLSESKRAIIQNSQPYTFPNPYNHILAILSRMDNADKHKDLTVIGAGLTDAFYRAAPQGWAIRRGLTRIGQFMEDGAIIQPAIPADLGYPEMDVEISGTATIHVKLAGVGSNPSVSYNMLPTLITAIDSVRNGLTVFESA